MELKTGILPIIFCNMYIEIVSLKIAKKNSNMQKPFQERQDKQSWVKMRNGSIIRQYGELSI